MKQKTNRSANSCRLHDQAPTYTRSQSYSSATPTYNHFSPPQSPFSRHFPTSSYDDGGPDIIPRFSPTQSRPRSYFNSEPYETYGAPASYAAPSTLPSTPSHANSRSSTALASLRELATALPKSDRHNSRGDLDSPPKSRASSISRTGSGVWNYVPFTNSQSQAKPITPGGSYTRGVSQSYGPVVYASYGALQESVYGQAKSYSQQSVGGYGNTGGMGMDRPLPPRSGPGYGHRPKSIDLVTPFGGH